MKEFFLKQKEAVYQGTRSALEKIPRAQIGWRPAPGMLSLGKIARHIWRNDHPIHDRAQVGAYLHTLTGQRASPYVS